MRLNTLSVCLVACMSAAWGCKSDDAATPSNAGSAGASGSSAGSGGKSALVIGGSSAPLECTPAGGGSAMSCTPGNDTGTGTPCCTTAASMSAYVASAVGVCGLSFSWAPSLCFEKAAAGKLDETCPQGLDEGWGSKPGCCSVGFHVCGILTPDVGCLTFSDQAKRPDGSAIGMNSGAYPCTPAP